MSKKQQATTRKIGAPIFLVLACSFLDIRKPVAYTSNQPAGGDA
jgi:hypothetical protein